MVPLTAFIEPIYEGEYAGNMLKFELAECAFVPAIFDHWTDKETGEVIYSFSILTTNPGNYVKKLVMIDPLFYITQNIKTFEYWFGTHKHNPSEFLKFLSKHEEPLMSVSIDRPLKSGWEKERTNNVFKIN